MTTREELKETRRALGLTQLQLAKMAGISRLAVLQYEKGASVRPSTEKAIRMAIRRELDHLTPQML